MKKIIILIIFIISLSSVNVNAEELSCSKTLVKGNKGDNVLLLQSKLNKLMSCNLDEDGIYGSKTVACVKKFQKKYSIKVTGTVNTTTCKKVNNLTKKKTTSSSKFDCTEAVDNSSEEVVIKQMQNRLNTVMSCSLEVDGIYGNATSACIRKFQLQYNLDDTGKMDTTTCKKLTSSTALKNKEKTLSATTKSLIIKDEEGNAKIRKSTNEGSKVLKTASLGDIYSYTTTVTKNGMKWYKIKLDNGYGYIEDEYIETNFIVVDITQQKLILYKNNRVLLNTKVVTGTYGEHDTPTGYEVLEKKNLIPGKYLRGYNPDGSLEYKSWVDYWMPFVRRIGFHDADWRTTTEYTNTRYMYDGSHGCVNMMKSDAKKLFNNITSDIAVIVRD